MTPLAYLFKGLIKGYQWFISPVLRGGCRFYPSCSAYAIEAVEIHGAIKGGLMATARISRCHPWNEGGIDPVPGSQLAKDTREHTHKHDKHGACCSEHDTL